MVLRSEVDYLDNNTFPNISYDTEHDMENLHVKKEM